VLGDPDAVEHERNQVEAGQVGGEQLRQGVLGGGDEPAGNRRPGGSGRRMLDLAAHRLQPVPVAAG
jgi:hypothetical protein